MLYFSTAGRRIVSHLSGLGIEPDLDDAYQIQLAATRFFPNHIIGVMDKVLAGKASRLTRAQEQGWEYFNKPVWSMLTKRDNAHRPISVTPTQDNALAVFRHVQTSLLVRDMDDEEAAMLIYKIPINVPNLVVLRDAIAICLDRDVRSVRYLNGVLLRRAQEKSGIVRRLRVFNEPWGPPEGFEPLGAAERARLKYEWEQDSEKNIEIMRKLKSL